MNPLEPSHLVYAILGGILPVLVWLWFWLKEDRLHPEPKKRIMLAFIAGMIAVPFVLPFEKLVNDNVSSMFFILVLWAVIEEVFKFGAAYFVALRSRDADEPIDIVIYMITAALGFAALENTFFLLNPLRDSQIVGTIVTGNLRFIGATLLHTICSAIVGITIAFEFYRTRTIKKIATWVGLVGAVLLHVLFNVSIMSDNSSRSLLAFYSVWVGAVLLILVFEKIKNIKRPFV